MKVIAVKPVRFFRFCGIENLQILGSDQSHEAFENNKCHQTKFFTYSDWTSLVLHVQIEVLKSVLIQFKPLIHAFSEF